MTSEQLERLKMQVHTGQITANTAIDQLYLDCLKEIGAAVDKAASIPILTDAIKTGDPAGTDV